MADVRPSLDAIDAAFGEPATLTVPGGSPVAVAAVILPPRSSLVPAGADLRTTESVKLIGLRRDQAPSVPTGTTIVIAGDTFTVDSVLEGDDELVKLVVR